MSPIHKDALAAWADLQERGGLELRGRDEGFEEELKNRIAPTAESLDEALRDATTDNLVRAFFDLYQPFVAMFGAILTFFERAGAAEGRQQWNIMVDEVDFRLDHFRRFLKRWNSVPCKIEVPAVDWSGVWRAMRQMPDMNSGYSGVGSKGVYWSGVADVDAWLRAYRERDGYYQEWPRSLAPSALTSGYSDMAALGLVATDKIREGYASREELIEEHRKRHYAMDRDDGLSIRSIAQNETDFWLETLVSKLTLSQTLPRASKRDVDKRLREAFARCPRKKVGARIRLADLQSYLSLPIWQKRHELYAVWIATEILNALPDHTCEIHHQDGKIAFAFRETVVATVKSAWPLVQLISERRVPLSRPVGKGRSNNVQPDYGLWRSEGGIDTCGLVVEVKHYKRSVSSSFGDVLTDYSRAFPKAQVYLVNHGPIGDATSHIPDELLLRCHTIKNLTAPHVSAREELSAAVRKYVGEPVAWASGSGDKHADTVLAVDVSASMSSHLAKPEFLSIVRSIADPRCANAALIDVEVRSVVPLSKLPEAAIAIHGSGTNLVRPVLELLRIFKRALIVTDNEGLDSLTDLSNQTVLSRQSNIIVVEVLAG